MKIRIRSALVLVPLSVLLTGCSPALGGRAGVGVDADGNPMAYAAVCEGSIDRISMFAEEGDNHVRLADGELSEPLTRAGHFSFVAPADGWKLTRPLGELSEETVYSIDGWSTDLEWSLEDASFTLSALKPGQVLYQEQDTTETTRDVIVEAAEFEAHACDDWTSSNGWW